MLYVHYIYRAINQSLIKRKLSTLQNYTLQGLN